MHSSGPRPYLRTALSLALLLSLGACAQFLAGPQGNAPVSKTSADPARNAKSASTPARTTVETAAKTVPQKAPGLLDLTGLRPGQMRVLLGPPAVERLDPPAQHWRYDGKTCTLHVFFFQRAGSYRVSHIDARALRNAGQKTAPPKVPRDLCIGRLWRAGPAHRASGKS